MLVILSFSISICTKLATSPNTESDALPIVLCRYFVSCCSPSLQEETLHLPQKEAITEEKEKENHIKLKNKVN